MTPRSPVTRDYPIRTATPDDWPALFRADARAFGSPMRAEDGELQRPLIEFDRMLMAEDGDEPVGIAGAYSLQMSVPGGVRPVAGVTWVGVSPTHRRQGILTTLMRRQLTALHEEAGEPVAALWASESSIYGRFGYGLASSALALRIPREATAILSMTFPDPPDDGRAEGAEPTVSFADIATARDALAAVHEAQLEARAGQFSYDSRWWDKRLADPEHHRGSATELRCLLAHDGGEPRGYALFTVDGRWQDGLPAGELRVRDLTALDPTAYAALWRTVLGTDLVGAVTATNRPVDDPLLHLLADPRRAAPRVQDNLWVRLVDVGRALESRSYACAVEVVLEVHDDFCPWNAGRWRLCADGTGATCSRTRDAADVSLAAVDLGAAYLGGTTLASLGRAGRVREQRPGALETVSRACSTQVAPCCPTIF